MTSRAEYGHRSMIPQSVDRSLSPLPELAHLVPCAPVNDANMQVGLLSHRALHPGRLKLSPSDRQPIVLTVEDSGDLYRIDYPGKSAFLYLKTNPDKDLVRGFVAENFGREYQREDHLHLARVDDIASAGWQTFWTPLPDRKNWTHVRLVADRTMRDGSSPTIEDAHNLANVFSKKI